MKFLQKNLTESSSGEQVKSAVACTFRNHAAALKAAGMVRYTSEKGVEKTFNALNRSLDSLFVEADRLDDEVIAACLLAAGYRSGRDLTELENSVKTAESDAAPLEKRDDDLMRQAAACGDDDAAKHAAIMKERDGLKPALTAARAARAKARAALNIELQKDCHAYLRGFEKRAAMLTAVSQWLYDNAADRFEAIAQAADDAVRERAEEFAGRMLTYCDYIKGDDTFPLNQKGRRCSCAGNIEDGIVKAIKRPFNGGVGYKHLATGGTRYCDVPMKSGNEVTITKVTE